MKDRKLRDALAHLFTFQGFSVEVLNSFYYDSVLSKVFRIKYADNNLEIPLFGINNFMRAINDNYARHDDVFYMPLKYSSITSANTYKTPGMLFYNLLTSGAIKRAISSKRELYYGSNGIIMDAHKNPIILCVVKADKDARWTFKEFIMYINPKVFVSNGVLEKFIVSRLIPYIVSNGIVFTRDYSNFSYNRRFNITSPPKMIISDHINDFFVDSTERDLHDLRYYTEDFLTFIDNEPSL